MIEIEKIKDICTDAIMEMAEIRKKELDVNDPLLDLLLMNEDLAIVSLITKKLNEIKNQ